MMTNEDEARDAMRNLDRDERNTRTLIFVCAVAIVALTWIWFFKK